MANPRLVEIKHQRTCFFCGKAIPPGPAITLYWKPPLTVKLVHFGYFHPDPCHPQMEAYLKTLADKATVSKKKTR